jgi:hypothetical protein
MASPSDNLEAFILKRMRMSHIYQPVIGADRDKKGHRIRSPSTTTMRLRVFIEEKLEAPPGFEPGMEVLQTSALPLGDGADFEC